MLISMLSKALKYMYINLHFFLSVIHFTTSQFCMFDDDSNRRDCTFHVCYYYYYYAASFHFWISSIIIISCCWLHMINLPSSWLCVLYPHPVIVYYYCTRLCVLSPHPVVVYIYWFLHPAKYTYYWKPCPVLCILFVTAPSHNCVYCCCTWLLCIIFGPFLKAIPVNTKTWLFGLLYWFSIAVTLPSLLLTIGFPSRNFGMIYLLCCCPNIWTWIIHPKHFVGLVGDLLEVHP